MGHLCLDYTAHKVVDTDPYDKSNPRIDPIFGASDYEFDSFIFFLLAQSIGHQTCYPIGP